MRAALRVGIVGAGFMGTTYAEAFRKVRGARVVAVAGGSRAPALAERFGLECLPSVEALCRRPDIDAVVLTTPHFLHAPEAILAMREGKHVLVEKPMATTRADALRMAREAKRQTLRLAVGYHQRFRRINRRAFEVLRSGTLGRPITFQVSQLGGGGFGKGWALDPRSVGYFLGYGCHAVDMVRWAFGAEIESVAAQSDAYRVSRPVETLTNALVRFRGGLAGTILSTNILPKPGFPDGTTMTRVVCEKGVMDWRAASGQPGFLAVGIEGRDDSLRTILEEPALKFSGDQMLAENRVQAYRDLAQDFVDAIRLGRRPSADGSDGYQTVSVCLAAMESWKRGRTVSVPPPPKGLR